MESTIDIRKGRATLLLDLGGDILTQRNDRLIKPVEKLPDAGNRSIVPNLGGLSHVSSYGMGDLVKVRFSICKEGGCLELIVPTPMITRVFGVAHLASLFDMFASGEEALAGFD